MDRNQALSIFSLPTTAGPRQIDTAYRQQVYQSLHHLRHSPDKHARDQAARQLQRYQDAYKVLMGKTHPKAAGGPPTPTHASGSCSNRSSVRPWPFGRSASTARATPTPTPTLRPTPTPRPRARPLGRSPGLAWGKPVLVLVLLILAAISLVKIIPRLTAMRDEQRAAWAATLPPSPGAVVAACPPVVREPILPTATPTPVRRFVEPVRPGGLIVQSHPWTEVHLNGRFWTTAPWNDPRRLAAGNYYLEIRRGYGRFWAGTVTIEASKITRIQINCQTHQVSIQTSIMEE